MYEALSSQGRKPRAFHSISECRTHHINIKLAITLHQDKHMRAAYEQRCLHACGRNARRESLCQAHSRHENGHRLVVDDVAQQDGSDPKGQQRPRKRASCSAERHSIMIHPPVSFQACVSDVTEHE